jgi:wyosine [tRNA(Phe)-imidazoG37] synthetase (radical SAM superfamily)
MVAERRAMTNASIPNFSSVYGPVTSWRYGRSLGIDVIGPVSVCSFDCVYCQLGVIEDKTRERRVYVETARILADLQAVAIDGIDVLCLSGSGEPTLALNLGEILAALKAATGKPIGVLTNASLLDDPAVRRELALADFVAAKLDGVTDERFRRVDRPVAGISLAGVRSGLLAFRREYRGDFAVQTMLLGHWPDDELAAYNAFVRELAPDEIQLCAATRPRPLVHQLDARGGRSGAAPAYPVQRLKIVPPDALLEFAARVERASGIPARVPPT